MTDKRDAQSAVQRMHPAHWEDPVFFCSLAGDAEGGRLPLITTLWEHLVTLNTPLWDHYQTSGPGAWPIQVVYGPLGKPRLMVREFRGPAISFSENGGRVWAAVCAGESDIGIDVAGSDEFTAAYPVRRVFHPEELRHALRVTGGDPAAACALLWSVKEAFVKALGCAFHLVDPLQVRVSPAAEEVPVKDGAYVFPVGLSAKAQAKFPPFASRRLSVASRPLSRNWLSIAHLDRGTAVHE
jgi:phosphopantetheinyl transferase (holo-ACP synthase)